MVFKKLVHTIGHCRLRYILLLAFALRLAWYLLVLFTHPQGFWLYDSNEYWNIAYNLNEYGVFSRDAQTPLQPDYFRTPVYPFFILPTVWMDDTGNIIPFLQLVTDVFSCVFLYKIVAHITGTDRYGKMAAFLYALHFPALVMTSFVLSESLFLFLLCGYTWALLCCNRQFTLRRIIALGVWAGLCVLCKPVAFVLVFPTVAWLLVTKGIRWRSLVYCLGFVLVFYTVQFPWMYRNKQQFHHYFNSLLGEHLLFGYHTCHIYAMANHIDYFDAKEMLLDRFYTGIEFNPYEHPYEYAKLVERESYKILWQNKGLFLREHVKECVKFFVQPLRGYVRQQLGKKWYTPAMVNTGMVVQVLTQGVFYLFTAWYFLLVLLRKRKLQPVLFFLLLLLLLFCQFNTMPYTDARLRFPFDGWIIVLAMGSLYMIRQKPVAKEG